MFARARRMTRSNSGEEPANLHVTSNNAPSSVAPESPAVVTPSPLGIEFDFELPPSSSAHDTPLTPGGGNISRPWTSDGLGSAKQSPISFDPPVLPPIPRIASKYEKDRDVDRTQAASSSEMRQPRLEEARPIREHANTSDGDSTLKPRLSFEHPVDLLSLVPGTLGMGNTHGAIPSPTDSIPKMGSSLFPPRPDTMPVEAPTTSTATPKARVMTRSFIDSRDKPYVQAGSKQFARVNNHSTPDLLASQHAADPVGRPGTSRLRPQQSAQSLSSRGTSAGLSGTTARPSTQASSLSRTTVSTPIITIGTPYSETSASFPVPERIKKRPQGADVTATVAGVSVPTHYSSSSKVETRSGEGKKKGRLLNPMSVFQRRRTGQDTDNAVEERSQRQAQAQALARQKDVVAGGIKNIPANYDPSIKGKLVHDFSAPRSNRNTFGEIDPNVAAQVQASFGTPSPPSDGFSPRSSSLPTNQSSRENSSRLSARAPVFKEHLNEEADASGRISSIHAENLENKDFLQRASMHSSSNFSQDSAALPPFARRSQILDPAQAAFFQDNDSKRSSAKSTEKEPDYISPMTSPYEQSVFVDSKRSISPISPSNSKRTLGPPSPSFFSGFQRGDAQGPVSAVHTPRPVSADLAPPKNEMAIETPTKKSPMAVSPIEPLTPTDLPQRNPSRTSPIQLTPPSHDGRSQTWAASEPSVNTLTPGKRMDLDPTTGFPTPNRTPETAMKPTTPSTHTPSQHKSAEKRASAASRSKRTFSGPRHHASTASRFSFQYASGESAAEEHALEDKHRKLADRGQLPGHARGHRPDEDDEDYFDEDAMDDMDEMEMEDHHFQDQFPPVPALPSNPALQARQTSKSAESDDSGFENDDDDIVDEANLPYPDHSAYRMHSAIISPHTSFRPGTPDGYWRGSTIDHYMRDSIVPQRPRNTSGSSALTINTNVGPFGNVAKPESASSQTLPSLPDNRSRVVSGMSFSSASDVTRSPPARGSPGQWPTRTGAQVGTPSGLSMQIGTPESSNRDTSSNSESYRTGNGSGSARSMASSAPTQVTQSSPGQFGSPASLNGGQGNSSQPGTKHSSMIKRASENAKTASGLGLDALSFEYDDSPTIPFRNMPTGTSRSQHKSALSSSMIPVTQAGPSPPATVELRGNDDFRVDSFRQSGGGSASGGLTNLPEVDMPPPVPEKDPIKPAGFNFDGSPTLMRSSGPHPPLQVSTATFEAQPSPSVSNLSPGGSSAVYQGRLGRGLQVRNQQSFTRSFYPRQPISMDGANDDMYYDDGNFDAEDMHETYGDGINEDAFDDDSFLVGSTQHRRYNSAMTTNSVGSEGPYPAFAMPNAEKARRHDSELMLENLPLLEEVDPELAPRRNPVDKAPPFESTMPTSQSQLGTQADMLRYHAALADAANKAAADGRFLRVESMSTTRTPSGSSSRYDDDDQRLYSQHGTSLSAPRNGVARSASHDTNSTQFTLQSYSPPKMCFDFGFDQAPTDDDSYMNDDDLVAAANAEALAFDDEGFYGQEFHFYGRPRSNSGEVEAINGGYFGEDGDDGLTRNRSLKEPNLTPITERSEFSTRSSFIGLSQLYPSGAPSSANPFGIPSPALARVPVTPWTENDITTLDQLRKLRANAFGGSQTSLDSSKRSSAHSISGSGGNIIGHRPSYSGGGGSNAPPMVQASSTDSSNSGVSHPYTHPQQPTNLQQDALPSDQAGSNLYDSSLLATPKRPTHGGANHSPGLPDTPPTARKISAQSPSSTSHSRKGSSTSNHSGSGGVADSVTYVREEDPAGNGKSRWVLERRRTSSQGQLELVGRELVKGGWI